MARAHHICDKNFVVYQNHFACIIQKIQELLPQMHEARHQGHRAFVIRNAVHGSKLVHRPTCSPSMDSTCGSPVDSPMTSSHSDHTHATLTQPSNTSTNPLTSNSDPTYSPATMETADGSAPQHLQARVPSTSDTSNVSPE